METIFATHLDRTPTPERRNADNHRQPPTSTHGCDCNPEHPPLPPFSLLHTPLIWLFGCCQWLRAAARSHPQPAWRGTGTHSAAPAWTTALTRCFYLAGFQDVDLLLVHGVPVLLQKPLALVFHLPGHKGEKLRGSSPNTQGRGAPTTPLPSGAHPKNLRGERNNWNLKVTFYQKK